MTLIQTSMEEVTPDRLRSAFESTVAGLAEAGFNRMTGGSDPGYKIGIPIRAFCAFVVRKKKP